MRTQDELLDMWRFEHGVPDEAMFITELSRYRLYNPAKVNLHNADVLDLVRQPDNADDPNAIEVVRRSDGMVVGYLPREVSAVLASALDAGAEPTARFYMGSDVASGMVVVSGDGVEPLFPDLAKLPDLPDMDTGIFLKRRTEDINIDWYDQNAQRYSEGANRCNPKSAINAFIASLPPGGKVLDAGCGNGRDVQTLLEAGFEVHAFDASGEMCRLTAERTGGRVVPRKLRFSEFDDPPDSYDGIWAMASLVHTPADDLPEVVSKLRRALRPLGVLAACVKAGDQPEISGDSRRFMRASADDVMAAFGGGGDLSSRRDDDGNIQPVPARSSAGTMDEWFVLQYVKAPEPELRMDF